jgi:hypothetical protein
MELTSLDVSNNFDLIHLECNNNEIATLDLSANTKLQFIDCSNNSLTSLILPDSENLEMLDCDGNQLSEIDLTKNVNLVEIHCTGNEFSKLDISPLSKLVDLFAFENQLTEIIFGSHPVLESLNLFSNQLSEINLIETESLNYLNLSNNQFTVYDPNKYPNLTSVHINGNFLTEIDLSRPNLLWIDVSDNQLTEVDVSNNHELVLLYCRNNDLEYINIKNGWSKELNNFSFSGNPNLKHICADKGELNSVLSRIESNGYDMVTASTYCDFVPGEDHNIFKGTVYYDNEGNDCDTSALPLSYQQFEIKVNEFNISQHISDGTGSVTVPLKDGSYTIKPSIPNRDLFNISPDSIYLSFPNDSSYIEQSFCVKPKDFYDDVSVSIFGLEDAVPGFNTPYRIKVYNQGTTFKSGEITLTFPDNLMTVSASSENYVEQGNQLTWQYEDLSPFKSIEIDLLMQLNTPMDTPPLNQDDTLCMRMMVMPIETDITPENNIFKLNQIVVNSLDPNDKTCLQGEVLMDTMIGTYLDYLIRFENLGTANARNIVVKDELDSYALDLRSIEVADASHPMYTRIDSRTIEFIFEDIQLSYLDSINDGYIAFRIKTKSGFLEVGDTIKNKAEIYFDFNFPVITNTYNVVIAADQDMDGYNSIIDCDDTDVSINPGAIDIIGNGIDEDCDGMDQLSETETPNENLISLYPNPTKGLLMLNKEVNSIELYNLMGEKILVKNKVQQINISELPIGVYFIRINIENKQILRKVIKN